MTADLIDFDEAKRDRAGQGLMRVMEDIERLEEEYVQLREDAARRGVDPPEIAFFAGAEERVEERRRARAMPN